MTLPADLRVGDQIPTTLCGALTVIRVVVDQDPAEPEFDRVYVDVEPEGQGTGWWFEGLRDATGAEAFSWLGGSPLRYRLRFVPTVDVQAMRKDEKR